LRLWLLPVQLQQLGLFQLRFLLLVLLLLLPPALHSPPDFKEARAAQPALACGWVGTPCRAAIGALAAAATLQALRAYRPHLTVVVSHVQLAGSTQ